MNNIGKSKFSLNYVMLLQMVVVILINNFWWLKNSIFNYDNCFAFSIFDWVKPWNGVKNQLSNFAISLVYRWSTLKKVVCGNAWMCVCLSGCLSVYLFVCLWVVNFLSSDNSKEVAPIALKFRIVICICFLKNPIDCYF